MTYKRLFLAFVCLFFFLSAHAQKNTYIRTDSLMDIGAPLVTGSAISNCQLIREKDGTTYRPEDILEYRLKNGTVYVSATIIIGGEEKRVFLQRLEEGRLTLYKYVERSLRTFFVQKDSSDLVRLDKELNAFREISADCPDIAEAISLASYTSGSLSTLTAYYNDCSDKPFPVIRYGVSGGLAIASLTTTGKKSLELDPRLEVGSTAVFTLGAFIEFPIYRTPVTLVTGAHYYQSSFSANYSNSTYELDALFDLKTISVPVLVRYTSPKGNVRPYFNFGVNVGFNISRETRFYEFDVNDDTILVDRVLAPNAVAEGLFGIATGVGLRIPLQGKKQLLTELRMNNLYSGTESFNQRTIDLQVGISF